MIQCQKCKAEIDADSWYCDQCGEAIMMCPNCKEPRKGKRCSTCGSVLVTAESLATGQQSTANPQQAQTPRPVDPAHTGSTAAQPVQTPRPMDMPKPGDYAHAGSAAPQPAGGTMRPEQMSGGTMRPQPAGPTRMVMIDDPSRVVVFRDGAIIGRKMGDYLSVFSDLGYTSSRHAQLAQAGPGNWLIIDLNSTNGTKVDGKMLVPNQGCMLNAGQIVEIGYKKFKVE